MRVGEEQAADTLFVGGGTYEPGTAASQPGGVAVAGGRVLAVGSDDELAALRGPRTQVVDLAGGLLLPGFQDSHIHPVPGGTALGQCSLYDAHALDAYLDRVSAYAAENRDVEWITGGGWSMDVFPGGIPRRELLDRVVPDRPVYLPNRDGHGAWVNTRALELAGIDARTPDPADGRIERDADGTPNGALQEGAAMIVGRLVPPPTDSDLDRALMTAQEYLFSLGITSWQDAMVGAYLGDPDPLPTYLRADRDGRLRARVVGALWWDRERGADQVPELVERRALAQGDRFRATSVKIMQDGVAENFTAAMSRPYLDACGCSTANAGISFVDPQALQSYVTELDANGFQVHVHAIGDRAVREALDAIEEAQRANGDSDRRHHLAHLQVVHPDDVQRFAQLRVAANLQALWACHEPQMDELTIPFLGGDLAEHQYPFGELHRAGAHLAMGSDWPVSSPDPMWGVHVAVNRIGPDEDDGSYEALLPHQALDLATALTAYTAGTAYVNHREHDTGTLRLGALADLVVLDRDPFAAAPMQIAATRVRQTYVEGQLVFDAG